MSNLNPTWCQNATVNDVWKWFDNRYKVHCLNKQTQEELLSWSGCEAAGIYYYPDGHLEYDVLIPAKHLVRVKRLMNTDSSESHGPKIREIPTVE